MARRGGGAPLARGRAISPCADRQHRRGDPRAARRTCREVGMRVATLEILRCPYCGGKLEVVTSFFHHVADDDVVDAILGCYCCTFPVIAGIPVLHLEPAAVAARERLEGGDAAGAARKVFALDDAGPAERFEEAARSGTATYCEL